MWQPITAGEDPAHVVLLTEDSCWHSACPPRHDVRFPENLHQEWFVRTLERCPRNDDEEFHWICISNCFFCCVSSLFHSNITKHVVDAFIAIYLLCFCLQF